MGGVNSGTRYPVVTLGVLESFSVPRNDQHGMPLADH